MMKDLTQLDELYYKTDKALVDLFYKAFEAGEDIVLQRQFENDPPAKHRYADRCIKETKNQIVDLYKAAIKSLMLDVIGEDVDPNTEDADDQRWVIVIRNKLRAELRERIKAL